MNEVERPCDAAKNGDFAMPEVHQEAVEVFPNAEKNETNQLCTEPESATPRKTKWKKKRKSLSKSEGAETNHLDSGHLESCPNLDPLPPKDSNPVLLPEPELVLERNETNQVCTELESTTPRKTKRKKKMKSLSKSEVAETNHMDSGHLESCPNLDPLTPKDSNPVLLPEPEPVSERNKTNQLYTEPESTAPRKTKRKRKKKSLSNGEGDETNHVDESCPNFDALSSKDSEPVPLPEPELVAKTNKTNQLYTEPELATPRKTKRKKKKRKSLSKSEGAETNHVDSGHLELCSNLDPLPPKNSDSVLLPEPESFAEKNSTNQLCIEPYSTPSRKTKRKSLSKSEGAETNHVDSGHLESCPNLDPLTPKDSNPVLLPEPEPVSERNETNQLCTEPESTAPRKTKRKRKKKSLSKSEGDETNYVDESCPNLDALSCKDSEPVPLPEPELVANTNKTNQLCTEPELATPGKTKRKKKKRKSLSKNEGAETNHVDSGHLELCSNLDPLPPKNSDSVLLPEPESFAEKNSTNQLCIEPYSTPSRKTKRKILSKSEGAETNHVDSGHLESCPNLDPLTPKDSNPVLLPEPEPVSERNKTNQLCTEPESTAPRKTKRKRKKKSLSKSEGDETNHVDESCPTLDTLSCKDSEPVPLPEPELVANTNKTNQLCTEPELATPGKTKRKKKKRKSLSKSEGAETNHVDSGHLELCSNLDPLPPKNSDSVLLPKPESFAEKNSTNQLCMEPDSTPSRKAKRKSLSKSEGAERNQVDSGHLESCPNLDPLTPKDSNPVLLPEPEPVSERNETNQLCTEPESTAPRKTKRKRKKKSLSKGEGDETNHVDESCPNLDALSSKDSEPVPLPEPELVAKTNKTNQLCTEPELATPRKTKRKKKKRKSLSKSEGAETNHVDSSIWSMVTPNYNFRPIIGASILNSEVVEPGPWVSKRPLNDYEQYEICLECRQICQGDQKCRGLIHLNRGQKFCFFCATVGHSLGKCPVSPGAKCAKGIIMLDDCVRKNCGEKSQTPQGEVAPANVPTYAPIYTHFQPSNIQPYPAPLVRPIYAHFIVSRN